MEENPKFNHFIPSFQLQLSLVVEDYASGKKIIFRIIICQVGENYPK
jgi:hypothetical protein